jgi:hypothetical protein
MKLTHRSVSGCANGHNTGLTLLIFPILGKSEKGGAKWMLLHAARH